MCCEEYIHPSTSMLHVDISLRGLQENLLDTVGFFWLNSAACAAHDRLVGGFYLLCYKK